MSEDSKGPRILIAQNGPYVVEDIRNLKDSKGNKIESETKLVLCRCGSNPIHCDGTHTKIGFNDEKIAGRKPDRLDVYAGNDITIYDNRGVCSHRGYCTDELPSVFKGGKEPWIDPNGASIEDIIRICEKCPSGALSYGLPGKERQQNVDRISMISISPKRYGADGPYDIQGSISLVDHDNNSPESKEHYTLCRCGGSKNKPFCDGTHWYLDYDGKRTKENIKSKLSPQFQPDQGNSRKQRVVEHLRDKGESRVSSMGTEEEFPSLDAIQFRAAQLHNFPRNEDLEVDCRTIIGASAQKPLVLEIPFYVSHMSYGAISEESKKALAKGTSIVGTAMCSGEGGYLPAERELADRWIYEINPSGYTRNDEAISKADAVEIKIGQAAKPGMGSLLPKEKITDDIVRTRGISAEKDYHTPAAYPDFNNAKEAKAFVEALRNKAEGRPIGVKFAAGDLQRDLEFALNMDPDFITIDCRGGGTGATFNHVKDNTGIPLVYAIPRARRIIDESGKTVTLCVTGGIRDSADIAKALALGADAVALATSSLISIGCMQAKVCFGGKCPAGIATQDPVMRRILLEEKAVKGFVNFYTVTRKELEQFTRLNGKNDVRDLSIKDLVTTDSDVSSATGVEKA